MSCPHAETTAILAVFGEAPADFAAHLVACAECRAVVDMHTETLPVLETAQPTLPARKRRWPQWSAGLLIAAAALLAVLTSSIGSDPDHGAIDSPVPVDRLTSTPAFTAFHSNLDSDLSDLELELALLNLE